MIKIIVIGLIFTTVCATPFDDCGSMYDLQSVKIENCNSLPCPLFMGKKVNVQVKMHADSYSRSLTQHIDIIMKNIYTPTESTPGPCTGTRPCPVKLNSDASFSAKLHVPNLAPFSAVLQWVIKNEADVTVMCFRTSVRLCDIGTDDELCYQS